MSADNGYYVQRNKAGKIVVQHAFASDDALPDPEVGMPDQVFDTLDEAVNAFQGRADDTEYGFWLRLAPVSDMDLGTYGPRAGLVKAVQFVGGPVNGQAIVQWIIQQGGKTSYRPSLAAWDIPDRDHHDGWEEAIFLSWNGEFPEEVRVGDWVVLDETNALVKLLDSTFQDRYERV